MRSLYWKIFLSFWLAMILIIITTALFSSISWHDDILLHPVLQKLMGRDEVIRYSDIQPEILFYELSFNILLTIIISGLICYFLSIYVTKPLRALGDAAELLGQGKLNTRVGQFFGHSNDEINRLSSEFNQMAERLEKILLSKERLLQDISHELRSPLARMHIALELLKQKTDEANQEELSRIELEAYRLNDLIGELLEFVRTEQSTDVLNLNEYNITKIVEDIVENANYECQNPQRVIITTIKEPVFLHIDRRLIERAIENIIRNALYYSPPDTSIDVAIEKDSAEKVVKISIRDRGPGVPEEQLEKIFNPFYRVEKAREKTSGGYGLGLSIAKQAIKLHNGTIRASKNEGDGLKVVIILPASANE